METFNGEPVYAFKKGLKQCWADGTLIVGSLLVLLILGLVGYDVIENGGETLLTAPFYPRHRHDVSPSFGYAIPGLFLIVLTILQFTVVAPLKWERIKRGFFLKITPSGLMVQKNVFEGMADQLVPWAAIDKVLYISLRKQIIPKPFLYFIDPDYGYVDEIGQLTILSKNEQGERVVFRHVPWPVENPLLLKQRVQDFVPADNAFRLFVEKHVK